MMNSENGNLGRVLKAGGYLLLAVGIVMVGRWLLFPEPAASFASADDGRVPVAAKINGDVQDATISLTQNAYAPIVVQKGIPVRFNIKAEEKDINSCNGSVVIPGYDVQIALKPGDNIMEFTPTETGTIPYSCWMGMITSYIQVVDDISTADITAIPVPVGGSRLKMPCCQ